VALLLPRVASPHKQATNKVFFVLRLSDMCACGSRLRYEHLS
jgi:hypothetical protein